MNSSRDLPNLLDDQPSHGDIPKLLRELRLARQRVFDDWAAIDRTTSSHKPFPQALDTAFVLALILEYVRRKEPTEFSTEPFAAPICEHVTVRAIAQALSDQTSNPVLKQVLCHSAFLEELPMPRDVLQSLFDRSPLTALADFNGQLPITILGDFHQLCLANPLGVTEGSRDRRREQGAHYTPPALVDYMVSRSLGQLLPHRAATDGFSVLDPSCGGGAFLIGVLRYLASHQNETPPREVLRCLHGSDIDARAIDLAQLSLLIAYWDLPGSVVPASVTDSIVSQQLVTQDFLAKPGRDKRLFDLIIGGPPFIRMEALHKVNPEQVARYRAHYQTAQSGQFDIYMPFVEKAVGLLKAGGCLAFSVASSFLRTMSGASLRQLLASCCQVEEIIEFVDGNIYPDASVQIAILVLTRRLPGNSTRYAYVRKRGLLRPQLQRLLGPLYDHEHDDLKTVEVDLPLCSSAWRMYGRDDTRFITQLEAVGTPLGKLPISLSLGMCTGADSIFMLKPIGALDGDTLPLLSRKGVEANLESAILKPILRGRYVTQAAIAEPPHLCIFPYDEMGKVFSEERFRHEYPRTYEYLREYKDRLSQRRLCAGQPWYALRKVDVARHLGKPKLIAATICSPGSFFLDTAGILCHHSILTIAPTSDGFDIHYLLGLLNSAMLWRYISLRAASMGENRRILRLELMKALPILLPDKGKQRSLATRIAQLALSLQEDNGHCENSAQMGHLDKLVNRLYGVNAI